MGTVVRTYITKSKAGHYTMTSRNRATGVLVGIIDKLPTLEAARKEAAIAKATGGKTS